MGARNFWVVGDNDCEALGSGRGREGGESVWRRQRGFGVSGDRRLHVFTIDRR